MSADASSGIIASPSSTQIAWFPTCSASLRLSSASPSLAATSTFISLSMARPIVERLSPAPEESRWRSDQMSASALRLWHDADIGLRRLPALWPQLLGVVVAHRACDDHVIAVLPVHRRRHLVLGRELQRVDDAQHLVEVAAGGHRVDQDQLALLVRPDHEHVVHGLVVGGRAL